MTYTPQVNDFVLWDNGKGIEGWVYFADEEYVTIEHVVDGQKYISAYHHVESGQFPFKVGDTVKAGDRIATMGNTGCSFGRHLHIELWKGPIYGSPSVDLGALLYGP